MRKFFRKTVKPLATIAMTMFCIALITLAPLPVQAVQIEHLTVSTSADIGYNWRCVVTYQDLTNAAAAIQTVVLLPGATAGNSTAGYLPTNWVITGAAYLCTTGFTNSGASNTNLSFYLGVTGNTNIFFNGVELDTRGLSGRQFSAATNATVFTDTNAITQVVAVFKQAGGTPLLSSVVAGQIEIFFRAVDLNLNRRYY